jgi:hypothetical protein
VSSHVAIFLWSHVMGLSGAAATPARKARAFASTLSFSHLSKAT